MRRLAARLTLCASLIAGAAAPTGCATSFTLDKFTVLSVHFGPGFVLVRNVEAQARVEVDPEKEDEPCENPSPPLRYHSRSR